MQTKKLIQIWFTDQLDKYQHLHVMEGLVTPRDAAAEDRWQGIFKAMDDQLVSSDIVGDPHAAIADLSLTKVVDGDLCSVYSWYDNEFGYTNSLVMHVLKVAKNV